MNTREPASGDVWARRFTLLIFILMLIVGLFAYDDYGNGPDEMQERRSSIVTYRYINQTLLGRDVFVNDTDYPPLESYEDRYYGVAMQLPMVLAEDLYQQWTGAPMPIDAVLTMRHLYTFLVYYIALLCFYAMLHRLLNSRWAALCGVLMVFLFGRFFAHSFYNIKDMIFASLMMICLFLAERVLSERGRRRWCVLFAIVGALLVSSRIVGALVIVLLLMSMLLQDALTRGTNGCHPSKSGWLSYLLLLAAYPIWLLITPASWSNPISYTFDCLATFSDYSAWHGYVAYCGRLYLGSEVPRGYFVVWIVLTVPLCYLLFSVVGIWSYGRELTKRRAQPVSSRLLYGIMLIMLVFTLGYQIVKKPTLYNGWRHAFYLYPMLIAFAAYGLNRLLKGKGRRAAIVLMAVSLIYNAYSIAASHPHEYAMFNVAGKPLAIGFERDYWHITNRELLEWLSAYDPEVNEDDYCSFIYAKGEPEAELQQMLKKSDTPVRYILLNYSRIPNTNEITLEHYREVYAVWQDQVKLSAVLERTEE